MAIIEANSITKEGKPSSAIPFLEGIVAGGINLSKLSLEDANLYRADLTGANLSNADLNGANLNQTFLNGVNLGGVRSLIGASLDCKSMMSAVRADNPHKASNMKVLAPLLKIKSCSPT